MSDDLRPVIDHPRTASAVFIHGLFSGPEVWNPLIALFRKDPVIQRAFHLECFAYSSPKFEFRPWRRIPTINEVASKLKIWLRENDNIRDSSHLALVGHSQGGLVIQQYLSTLLQDGRSGEELRRIRAVVLLATPNTGSELFLSLRRGLERIWYHAQERQLRPYDEAIEDIRRVVLERMVLATGPMDGAYPIRFFAYAGESDRVVPARSAQWMFPGAGILPGDHSSILRPADAQDLRYKAIRSALRWARHSFPVDGMLFETEALDLTRQEEINAVVNLESERFHRGQGISPKDLKHWLQNYDEKWALRLAVLVAKLNGKICGFIMFHESADLIIVDYIAVKKGSPYSRLLVERMVKQLTWRSIELGRAPIVFEVEHPASVPEEKRLEAQARIVLFQGMGASVIGGLRYLAPDMQTMKKGDETLYALMYVCPDNMPFALSAAAVRDIIRRIYLIWYRNWFSHYPDAERRESYLRTLYENMEKSVEGTYPLVSWKRGCPSP